MIKEHNVEAVLMVCSETTHLQCVSVCSHSNRDRYDTSRVCV